MSGPAGSGQPMPLRARKVGLTGRQREVLLREPGVAAILMLLRERPGNTCVVCWRDLHHARAEALTCGRRVGGVQVCANYLRRCHAVRARLHEAAKLSLTEVHS